MSRILFKENSDGTYDILDRDSNASIYNVKPFELALIYEELHEMYNGKVDFESSKLDMVKLATDVCGFGGSK